MIDELGIRMKTYENITRYYLMPRTYNLYRIDGRSFHSYLRGCKRPFDKDLIEDMDNTAIYLCSNIQGAKFGFVQSDEISILATSFDDIGTQAFFEGNIQKNSSVVASMATAKFNQLRFQRFIDHKSINLLSGEIKLAEFDCRVWNIPSQIEVMNYFRWRNQDCSRNSVSMVAQSLFSHSELDNKSTNDKKEMIRSKGIDWDVNYTNGEKNGRIIMKETYTTNYNPPEIPNGTISTSRHRWISEGAWKFIGDNDKLLNMIPKYEV